MKDLLASLTPPEFWVWGWLSDQYRCGRSEIISIEQGNSPALYSRKQLTRILRSLALKKFLVIDHLPGNQHRDLVVVIASRRCLDIGVQAAGHPRPGDPGFEGEKGFARPSMSRQRLRGNGDGTKALGLSETPMSGQECSASASARKDLNLKALVEVKDQKQLLKEICGASNEARESLMMSLLRVAPMARGKRLSRAAVLYAAVRYVQDGGVPGAKNPAAWVESVAKRAELSIKQGTPWNDGKSGGAGRSPSLGKFARG